MKKNDKFNFLNIWVFCVVLLFSLCIVGGISSKGTLAASTENVAFEVYIKNITHLGFDVYVELSGDVDKIKKVSVPVWTKLNSQDDLKRYEAEKVDYNTWRYKVNTSDHNSEFGTYYVDVYAYDDANKTSYNDAILKQSSVAQVFEMTAKVENIDKNGYYVTVYAPTISNLQSMKFPTWTLLNGQDDLPSYDKWPVGSGSGATYKYSVRTKDHNSELGTYATHVYALIENGKDKIINKSHIFSTVVGLPGNTVNGGNSSNNTNKNDGTRVEIKNITDSSFDIYFYVDENANNVKTVYFPTWNLNNDQDDVVWYEAEKLDSKTWHKKVNISDHDNEYGAYSVHVYASDKVDAEHSECEKVNSILFNVVGLSVEVKNISKSGYDVYVRAPIYSGMQKVEFPTWTLKNEQDDLNEYWPTGKKVADNKWYYRVNTNEHNNELGTYVTHVYVTSNEYTSAGMINISVNLSNIFDDNVSGNPQTGSIAMFIVWVIGLCAMGYSIYYFKKMRNN